MSDMSIYNSFLQQKFQLHLQFIRVIEIQAIFCSEKQQLPTLHTFCSYMLFRFGVYFTILFIIV